MNAGTMYRRSADVVAARVDDELVMLNLQAGNYYGIRGVGTLLWELLTEPRSMDELVHAVIAGYDISREQCTADVGTFVDELLELELLESV